MQDAITRGIAASVWGATQQFSSLLYTDVYGNQQEVEQKEFPYDINFMSAKSIEHLKSLEKNKGHEAWPHARIRAYQGNDIVAKRAAASSFLWSRYDDEGGMSLERLKLWLDIEEYSNILAGVPSWFRNQHLGEDVNRLWKAYVGEQRWKQIEQQHQAAVQKLLVTK
jgi:hypothetical protein